MPNIFAYLALYAWPIIAIVLFRMLPLQKAIIWTLLGGYLLLPSATSVKLPMLPPIDKTLVTSLPALILAMFMAPPQPPSPEASARMGRLVLIGLVMLVFFSTVLTVLQNPNPVIDGKTFLPGLRLYDAWSMSSTSVVAMIPLWLGIRYFNNPQGHRVILEALVLGGLFYTIPVLFEVRFSPQLHTWIYGFFQHNFAQHVRNGGFRPIVFLSHGLLVGIFLCISVISAIALYSEARRERKPALKWLLSGVWLLFVLYLSKNFGAFASAVVLSAFAMLTGRKAQIILGVSIAAVVMFYPMLRGAGWIPVQATVEFVESIDLDRANSLRYRLNVEDALLERANEKPIAGWGTWGRNLIHDPTTGLLAASIDGIWVAFIGMFGWLGYIGRFGLLTAPILLFALRNRTVGPSYLNVGLTMVLCATLIDLLPNSGLVSYVWLMAGAIAGQVVWSRSGSPVEQNATVAKPAERGRAAWLMPETQAVSRTSQPTVRSIRSRR